MEQKHRRYLPPCATHSDAVEIRNAAFTGGGVGQLGSYGCDDTQSNNNLSSSWSCGNRCRGLQTL